MEAGDTNIRPPEFTVPEKGWFASLPQYDLPSVRQATDAWWAGIRRHLMAQGVEPVPKSLLRTTDAEADWRRPDLLVSQTCGYPLMTELRGALRAVATPVYTCPGCEGPRYRSALIIREEDNTKELSGFRGRKVAVNNPNSHSGMNVLRYLLAPLAKGGPFFSEIVWSGGHAFSLEAVKAGQADLAAIDCVTFALLQRDMPEAVQGLRVMDWTPSAPSLPYAMRHEAPLALRQAVFTALEEAAQDSSLNEVRATLMIEGVVASDDGDYRLMLDWAKAASDLDYPTLA